VAPWIEVLARVGFYGTIGLLAAGRHSGGVAAGTPSGGWSVSAASARRPGVPSSSPDPSHPQFGAHMTGRASVGLDDLEEVARRIAEGRFTNRAECTLEVSTYVWNRNSFEAQHHFEDACTDHGIRFAVVERVGGIEWSCPKAAGT
jgi:hypothetical protein